MKKIAISFVVMMFLFNATAAAVQLGYQNDDYGLAGTFPEGWRIVDSRMVTENKETLLTMTAEAADRAHWINLVANRRALNAQAADLQAWGEGIRKGYLKARPNAVFSGRELKERSGHDGVECCFSETLQNGKTLHTQLFAFAQGGHGYCVSALTLGAQTEAASRLLDEMISRMRFTAEK